MEVDNILLKELEERKKKLESDIENLDNKLSNRKELEDEEHHSLKKYLDKVDKLSSKIKRLKKEEELLRIKNSSREKLKKYLIRINKFKYKLVDKEELIKLTDKELSDYYSENIKTYDLPRNLKELDVGHIVGYKDQIGKIIKVID